MSHLYPSHSPYNYCLNNPINLVDPTGMEARFADSSQAADVANSLNEENEGANVTVEQRQTEEVSITLPLIGKIVLSESKTYWALSTANSNFDWSQNEITSALYDVINSEDIVFDVTIAETYDGWNIAEHMGGGRIDPRSGGGSIYLSPEGTHWESLGVRFMHEAVGHGHPVTGVGWEGNATKINYYYNRRFDSGHYGYHKVIGWDKTGLYKPYNPGNIGPGCHYR